MWLNGISTYSEPGDWFTYELTHYCLSRLAEDPEQDVAPLIGEFCEARYGASASVAAPALLDLGSITRRYGSIPGTSLKSADEIAERQSRLRKRVEEIGTEIGRTEDEGVAYNLNRLLLVFEYARRDLAIQHSRASGAPIEETRKLVEDLSAFLKAHESEGVFVFHSRTEPARLERSYGLAD